MKKNSPFPPKNSMFWNHSSYTYEEAVSVHESEGSLCSLTQKSQTPCDNIANDPPKHSMFWEGCTSKVKHPAEATPAKETERLHFTQKKEPPEGSRVRFIPVRYAIDELKTSGRKCFDLPPNWKGRGRAKLCKAGYTLRQLRDGWLYVYDAANNTLDEYQVTGTTLTHFQLAEAENPELPERGSAQPSFPYLTYANDSLLSFCFSTHRWTWTQFLAVINNPSCYSRHMQTVVLNSPCHSHIGHIDQLVNVADIEQNPVNDNRFIDSSVLTLEPETVKNSEDKPETVEDSEDEPPEVKPVALISDFIFSDSLVQPTFFVAINDPAAEIKDIALHFAAVACPYRLFEEEYANKWTLMQTAMQLCMFGDTEDIKYPPSVNSQGKKLEFYIDMGEYYDFSKSVELVKQNQGGYAAQFSYGSMGSAISRQTKLAKTINEKYRVPIDSFDKYNQWTRLDRWRKHLNWREMLEEMRDLSTKRERLLNEVKEVKADFIKILGSLRPHDIERLFDLCSEDTQRELCELHLMVVESFTLVLQEDDKAWAEKEWEKPTSLWALFTACFSRQIFNAFTLLLEEMEQEKILLPSLEHPEENENTQLENASTGNNLVTAYSKFIDFMTNEHVNETKIFKELALGLKQLDKIMSASMSSVIKGVANIGVSVSAQASTLLLTTLTTQPTRHSFYWRVVVAERMASNSPIIMEKNYADKFKDWQVRINTSIIKLNKANETIKEKNTSDKQKSDAIKIKREVMKTLNANAFKFPSRIVHQKNMEELINKSHKDILSGKIKNIADNFKLIGGLSFIPFIFYLMSLADAMSTIKKTGLLSKDDALNLAQNAFYMAAALTGIRASKAWVHVKGDPMLRSISQRTLGNLIKTDKDFKSVKIDELKIFNKLLATTAVLGMFASGIEAYRSWGKIDVTYGYEQILHRLNTGALSALTIIGAIQTFGAITGLLSANFISGAVIMGAFVVVTAAYLLINLSLAAEKKDDYQQWLSMLPWGDNPKRQKWSKAEELDNRYQENSLLVQNALFDLQRIIEQPTVYHSPIHNATYHYTDKKEIIALDVHIAIPNQATYHSIKLQTSNHATEEQLMAGTWHQNVALNTLEKNKENTNWVYQVRLPVEPEFVTASYPIQSDKNRYLSLSIEYHIPDAEKTHRYLFQQNIKQPAHYTAISDQDSQEKVEKNLTSITAEFLIRN